MRVKVGVKSKSFSLDAAPEGVGRRKSGNAAMVFDNGNVVVEMDEEAVRKLQALFDQEGQQGG